MSSWAKHFRNHYCLDTQIDALRKGTGHTRSQYLLTMKFPSKTIAPGPSIRSGDFCEILVADFLQYNLNYFVPRTRYSSKTIKNESTKGGDILGFKILKSGKHSKNDELAIFEAKGALSGARKPPRLQDAVDDSIKDEIRKAESLNAIKQRYLDANAVNEIATIERFQNFADHPYKETYGAVAIFTSTAYCQTTLSKTDASKHPKSSGLSLMVIKGDDLMALVHTLYELAANEA